MFDFARIKPCEKNALLLFVPMALLLGSFFDLGKLMLKAL